MANTVQDELAEKLSPILKKDIVIRNSHLLRAHAIVSPLGLRSSICGTQPFGSSDGSEGLVYLKKSQNGS